MRRYRHAKIVATLGPSSSDSKTIRALFDAGADVFRLNFSHGSQAQHKERLDIIRAIERDTGRPIAVLLDLQGPKLRVGTFAQGPVELKAGAAFRLDMDPAPGDATRAPLLHPEIFAALKPDTDLLLDDGKIRLKVDACGPDFAATRITTGGPLSDRKGVNVPGVILPISIITEKDRVDLEFGLELGVDWLALSFVQRPQDLDEARSLIIQANHADTESVVPLLAYYRSYQDAGQAIPDAAIDGVAKSLDAVPSAPTTRLMLGNALVGQHDLPEARRVLLPLADGAFDPPEKPRAQQLLQSLAAKSSPGKNASAH